MKNVKNVTRTWFRFRFRFRFRFLTFAWIPQDISDVIHGLVVEYLKQVEDAVSVHQAHLSTPPRHVNNSDNDAIVVIK